MQYCIYMGYLVAAYLKFIAYLFENIPPTGRVEKAYIAGQRAQVIPPYADTPFPSQVSQRTIKVDFEDLCTYERTNRL